MARITTRDKRLTNLEEADDEEVEVGDAAELLKEVLEDEREDGVFGCCDVVVGVLLQSLAREAAHRDTSALFPLLFSSEEPYLHCSGLSAETGNKDKTKRMEKTKKKRREREEISHTERRTHKNGKKTVKH